MTPASRAHRILRRLQSFQRADGVDFNEIGAPALRTAESTDESWLGIYWSPERQIEGSLLFSDRRLCVARSNSDWECVDYLSMRDVLVPDQKTEAMGLIVLYDWQDQSREFYVPVHGGQGRLRDAYQVMQFLKWVPFDIARATRPT